MLWVHDKPKDHGDGDAWLIKVVLPTSVVVRRCSDIGRNQGQVMCFKGMFLVTHVPQIGPTYLNVIL